MSAEIKVVFDRSNGVYHSGELISGNVLITVAQPILIKGILINLQGFGKAEWDDDKKKKKKEKSGSPHYTGFEEYLSMNTYLLQSVNGNALEMPVGTQSFVFKCNLPEDLPASFEGLYGHIRYIIKVTIEIPGKSNQSYVAGFTVCRIVELQRECPQYQVPIEVEKIKTLGCGICKSTPMILKATIPQSGFLPGQVIPIKIHISSLGSLEAKEIRLYLRKLIMYRASKPLTSFKEESVDLLHKTCGHLQPASVSDFDENLLIPAVPSSTQNHSKIIEISYDIKIEAILNDLGASVILLCPITIGSVGGNVEIANVESDPIVQREEQLSFGKQERRTSSQDTTAASSATLPSYELAVQRTKVKLDEDDKHSIQSSEFTPRYPVYQFQSASQSVQPI